MALVNPIPQANAYRYRAFVSYAHADQRWADWLVVALESFRIPRRLVGRETPVGPIPRTLAPLFFDRDQLPTSANLSASIRRALDESAYLLVVCSPAAAASRWVNEEVRIFREAGRGERILAVIVDGEPGDPDNECLPPALKEDEALRALQDPSHYAEPAAADLRPGGDGERRAVMRLAAGLTGVSYGELVRRELHRRQRRLALITAGSVAGMGLTLALASAAWIARKDAERSRQHAEDLVTFMVGDLRERLEPVGRLDVLDAVGDKALDYFAALKGREVTDATLANRGRVLQQLGEIRLSQGRSEQALEVFTEAYEVTRELARRSASDHQRLFDRSQAEFWVGFVHMQRKELEQAEAWLTRYQDSAAQLVSRDPDNRVWQRELVYALHNLGVVRLRRARLPEAAAVFATARARLEALIAAQAEPGDGELEYALADEIAWQAVVAERSGQPRQALELYLEHKSRLDQLVARDPDNMMWRLPAANADQHIGRVSLQLGRLGDARRAYAGALEQIESLTAHDEANLDWQRDLAACHAGIAEIHLADGDTVLAARHGEQAVALAEQIVSSDPANADWLRLLANAEAVLGLALLDGYTDPPDRQGLENNALLAERLLAEAPDDPSLQRTAAMAWLALGADQGRTETRATARESLDRVLEIGDSAQHDPALALLSVQALERLGDLEAAERLARGLIDAGYRHPRIVAVCADCSPEGR